MNFEVITENNFWLGSLRGIVSVNSWVVFLPAAGKGLKIPLSDQVENSLQRPSWKFPSVTKPKSTSKFLVETNLKIPLSDQAGNTSQWPSQKFLSEPKVENSSQLSPQNSSKWPSWKFLSVTNTKSLSLTKSKIPFNDQSKKFLLETKLKIPLRHHHKGLLNSFHSSQFFLYL